MCFIYHTLLIIFTDNILVKSSADAAISKPKHKKELALFSQTAEEVRYSSQVMTILFSLLYLQFYFLAFFHISSYFVSVLKVVKDVHEIITILNSHLYPPPPHPEESSKEGN